MANNHFYFNWLYRKSRYRHLYNVCSSLFIWLFLVVALPFGLYNNNLGGTLQLALFLFPLAICWMLISYGIDAALGNFLFSVKRSIWLWLIKVVVLIHVIYFIREWLCDESCIDLSEYLELWLACFLLFAFTYIPFSLYGRYAYFHSLVGAGSDAGERITLIGEGREVLSLNPNSLIYARSDDNYVDIFLAEASQPGRKITFRCTLKSLEEQLREYPQLVRIHRSTLINMKYAVRKNMDQGKTVQLIFNAFSTELPVSKSYADTVNSLFTHPK